MRLTASGGVLEFRMGREHLRDVNGQIRLATPGADRAADRFEVDIAGGVRTIRVTTA